jgi:anti-sigma regulatory factor (Ser/Thr protein kinase)
VVVTAEAADAFRHEALLYEGPDHFLDGTLPFLEEGLDAGEEILVVVDRRRIRLLEGALGAAGAARVGFADMAAVGQNPARIIPLWRTFADGARAAGRGLRGIGEPVWPGRTAAQLAECHRHEALLNVAFAGDDPWALLCPYDVSALDPAVVTEAHRTHPTMTATSGSRYESTDYAGLEGAVAPFDELLPEPATPPVVLAYGADSLGSLRSAVRNFCATAGLDGERVPGVVLAVNEIATNSIRYGGGAGTLRLWSEPGAVLCETRDSGHITHPLVGRELPPDHEAGGRGLWIANQVCDLAQIRSSPDAGTVVRLHVLL